MVGDCLLHAREIVVGQAQFAGHALQIIGVEYALAIAFHGQQALDVVVENIGVVLVAICHGLDRE